MKKSIYIVAIIGLIFLLTTPLALAGGNYNGPSGKSIATVTTASSTTIFSQPALRWCNPTSILGATQSSVINTTLKGPGTAGGEINTSYEAFQNVPGGGYQFVQGNQSAWTSLNNNNHH